MEEALKVALLLLLMLGVASQRARRLAVVDFALLGMAPGAGFQLVEDVIRRVTAGPPGLFAVLLGDGSTQFRLLALFPGWQEDASAFFPGHFLLTALIALGIGWARRLRPRFGAPVVLLPVGLFVLAALDHSLYNFHVTGGFGPVPGWLEGLHQLWGAGREVWPLFLTLLLAAVVADYGVVESVRDRLPPLPGRPPAWALIAAGRVNQRLPEDAAPVFRRGAGALVAVAAAVSAALHEIAVILAAARSGLAAWLAALDLTRQRRKLAFAVRVAPADPLRVEPVIPRYARARPGWPRSCSRPSRCWRWSG